MKQLYIGISWLFIILWIHIINAEWGKKNNEQIKKEAVRELQQDKQKIVDNINELQIKASDIEDKQLNIREDYWAYTCTNSSWDVTRKQTTKWMTASLCMNENNTAVHCWEAKWITCVLNEK